MPVSIVVSSGNIGIDPGQSVLLTCISRGLPLPSIMWTDPSGSVITRYTNPRIKVFESTETRQGVTFVRSILQLCDINRMDSGEYTCIADNTFSNDTATISVCALGNVHTIFGTCYLERDFITFPYLLANWQNFICILCFYHPGIRL